MLLSRKLPQCGKQHLLPAAVPPLLLLLLLRCLLRCL